MKFDTNTQGPQRMNPYDFTYPLTIHQGIYPNDFNDQQSFYVA